MATNKVRSLHVAIIQQLVRKWERPWRHQRAIVLFAIRTLGSLFGNAARLDTLTADAIHRYQNLRQETQFSYIVQPHSCAYPQGLAGNGCLSWHCGRFCGKQGHEYFHIPLRRGPSTD
jgi:hypothetical protein